MHRFMHFYDICMHMYQYITKYIMIFKINPLADNILVPLKLTIYFLSKKYLFNNKESHLLNDNLFSY